MTNVGHPPRAGSDLVDLIHEVSWQFRRYSLSHSHLCTLTATRYWWEAAASPPSSPANSSAGIGLENIG